MQELSYLIIPLIAAGVVQGISGFGVGLIACGILNINYGPTIAVPSLVVLYLVIHVTLIYENRDCRKNVKQNSLFSFSSLALGVIFTAIGVSLLRILEKELISNKIPVQKFLEHFRAYPSTADSKWKLHEQCQWKLCRSEHWAEVG